MNNELFFFSEEQERLCLNIIDEDSLGSSAVEVAIPQSALNVSAKSKKKMSAAATTRQIFITEDSKLARQLRKRIELDKTNSH